FLPLKEKFRLAACSKDLESRVHVQPRQMAKYFNNIGYKTKNLVIKPNTFYIEYPELRWDTFVIDFSKDLLEFELPYANEILTIKFSSLHDIQKFKTRFKDSKARVLLVVKEDFEMLRGFEYAKSINEVEIGLRDTNEPSGRDKGVCVFISELLSSTSVKYIKAEVIDKPEILQMISRSLPPTIKHIEIHAPTSALILYDVFENLKAFRIESLTLIASRIIGFSYDDFKVLESLNHLHFSEKNSRRDGCIFNAISQMNVISASINMKVRMSTLITDYIINSKLQKLKLSNLRLTEDEKVDLARILTKKDLKELELESMNVKPEYFANYLRFSSLTSLVIFEYSSTLEITDNFIASLIDSKVNHLEINRVKWTNKDLLLQIKRILLHSKLKHVVLDFEYSYTPTNVDDVIEIRNNYFENIIQFFREIGNSLDAVQFKKAVIKFKGINILQSEQKKLLSRTTSILNSIHISGPLPQFTIDMQRSILMLTFTK
ncbi:hypothetical protein ROZALSC1DRAFT_24191, partial [Rozella allomycis CSF55]